MTEPTKEQIKAFWEWCGIKERFESDTGTWYYHYPNRVNDIELPPVDLNNLFKYAVPKFQDMGNPVTLEAYEHKGYLARVYKDCFTQRPDGSYEPFLEPIGECKDDDPALALFWAIWEVIHDKSKDR